MRKQSKAEKLADARIDRAFNATCRNIQIDIMDIPKVFSQGRELIAKGADDQALGVGIRAYVDSIRVKDMGDSESGCTFQAESL